MRIQRIQRDVYLDDHSKRMARDQTLEGKNMSQSGQSDIHGLITDQVADAIIYSDSEGIIRVWNAAAARIFGCTKVEAIGQSLDPIIPEGRH